AAAKAAGVADRVMLSQAAFERFDFPESYDAVYSGFSLPFCPESEFEDIWWRLRDSLKPGGVLAFQLFGDRDGWANCPEHADDACFHSRAQVERFLEGTERLFDDEVEKDGHTALGEAKYWHVFHLIVRQP
ncbi:MAG: class I SAM-dependent methyltransferase, partial [Phycisphaerales bacterium JB038]